MEFVIASNISITLAWWTGTIFTLVSILCIGYMFGLRKWSEIVKNRREAVTKKWEETLYEVTVIQESKPLKKGQKPYQLTSKDKQDVLLTYIEKGRFDPVEPLPNQDLPHFLFVWNYLHESLRGNSKERLNLLANDLKIDHNTYKMLKSRSLKNQILAINTFGNLREQKAYEKIEKLIYHRDPIISLWAWRALFRINFEETLKNHFSMIVERKDWSPTFVAKILLELDKDLFSVPLVRLVEESYEKQIGERQMARLVSYLTITHISSFSPLINKILNESTQTEVVIACLRLVKSDESLERVRELIKSERWEIRLQVVQTLGRLGHDQDVELLIQSLNDLDWWVRYRTAGALMIMPSMTEEKIADLAETLPNEFARDILRQVLAENRLLCLNQTSSSILSK
ncbi:MAG: HEAT repeat domain-containing protein [Actinomycetota bacterium]